MDPEPTHHLSPELPAKLTEAKDWYDQHVVAMETLTADKFEASSLKGTDLLLDVIEIMDREWGFAQPLPGTAP